MVSLKVYLTKYLQMDNTTPAPLPEKKLSLCPKTPSTTTRTPPPTPTRNTHTQKQ